MAIHAKRGPRYHLPTPECRPLLYDAWFISDTPRPTGDGECDLGQSVRWRLIMIYNFKLEGLYVQYKGCSHRHVVVTLNRDVLFTLRCL